MKLDTILHGDCRQLMATFPEESIDLVVTSPPYWGLRHYGDETITVWGGDRECDHQWEDDDYQHRTGNAVSDKTTLRGGEDKLRSASTEPDSSDTCIKCGAWRGQLGLEPHPQMFVDHLLEISRDIKRVLKPSGSFWLNIGDTYHGGKRKTSLPQSINRERTSFWEDREIIPNRNLPDDGEWLQPKQLLGIPWRVAHALQHDGWVLRNAIIWYKPNHMPESVTDRLTKSYEFVFFFVKERYYYFDLDEIREPHRYIDVSGNRISGGFGPKSHANMKSRNTNLIHPDGKNPGDSWKLDYDSKYTEIDDAPTQGSSLTQKKEIERAQSRIDARKLFSNNPAKQQEYINFIHDHGGHSLGKNPGDSWKYGDINTEKDHRQGMHKLGGDGLIEKRPYLPPQQDLVKVLRDHFNPDEIAQETGIPVTTVEHWFRTDDSGFSYPSTEHWKMVMDTFSIDILDKELTTAIYETDDVGKSSYRGKNPGDFWNINTQPFPGAHFAVFPESLIERIVKCACPKHVCPKCGTPYERDDPLKEYIATRPGNNTGSGKSGTDNDPNQSLHSSDLSAKRQKIVYYPQGYHKTCDCRIDDAIPGTVLDLFVGSGTTCVVAKRLNRHYIGIDMNPEYVEMARDRVAETKAFNLTALNRLFGNQDRKYSDLSEVFG